MRNCDEKECSLYSLRFGIRQLEDASISLSLFQNAVPAMHFKGKQREEVENYGQNLLVEKIRGRRIEHLSRDISLIESETFELKS